MDRYQKLIEEKAKRKRELFGSMFFPRTPVLLLDVQQKGAENSIDDLMDGLRSIGLVTMVVGGEGKNSVRAHTNNQKEEKLKFISEDSKEAAYRAADFILVWDGSPKPVWKAGSVPIAKMNGCGTEEYNPLHEKGNGFYFKNSTKWEVFAAVVRALETYQFPYDWENLVKSIAKKAQ